MKHVKKFNFKEDDKILIVAPHADDESIGCGGLLSLYPNQCTVMLVTDGEKDDSLEKEKEMIKNRELEFDNALNVAGGGYKVL